MNTTCLTPIASSSPPIESPIGFFLPSVTQVHFARCQPLVNLSCSWQLPEHSNLNKKIGSVILVSSNTKHQQYGSLRFRPGKLVMCTHWRRTNYCCFITYRLISIPTLNLLVVNWLLWTSMQHGVVHAKWLLPSWKKCHRSSRIRLYFSKLMLMKMRYASKSLILPSIN